MPIIAQYIYDGDDLGHPYIQSTTVLNLRITGLSKYKIVDGSVRPS